MQVPTAHDAPLDQILAPVHHVPDAVLRQGALPVSSRRCCRSTTMLSRELLIMVRGSGCPSCHQIAQGAARCWSCDARRPWRLAVLLLRQVELEVDYAAAWDEWVSSGNQAPFQNVTGDGIPDAAG
jgi:hypothetical protein